jgi:hypothetical protein
MAHRMGLALVLAPIELLYNIVVDLQIKTADWDGAFDDLGHKLDTTYTPVADVVYFDIVSSAAFIAGFVYFAFLFFKKKKTFPQHYIVFVIVAFVVRLEAYLALSANLPLRGISGGVSWTAAYSAQRFLPIVLNRIQTGLLQTVLPAIIGISCLLTSRRVKVTFIH